MVVVVVVVYSEMKNERLPSIYDDYDGFIYYIYTSTLLIYCILVHGRKQGQKNPEPGTSRVQTTATPPGQACEAQHAKLLNHGRS